MLVMLSTAGFLPSTVQNYATAAARWSTVFKVSSHHIRSSSENISAKYTEAQCLFLLSACNVQSQESLITTPPPTVTEQSLAALLAALNGTLCIFFILFLFWFFK